MCFFGVCLVDTDVAFYDGRHSHNFLSWHKRRKKGKYLEYLFEKTFHFTSCVLSLYRVMGEENFFNISNCLIPCNKNSTGDTVKHAGMSGSIFTLTWCMLSD